MRPATPCRSTLRRGGGGAPGGKATAGGWGAGGVGGRGGGGGGGGGPPRAARATSLSNRASASAGSSHLGRESSWTRVIPSMWLSRASAVRRGASVSARGRVARRRVSSQAGGRSKKEGGGAFCLLPAQGALLLFPVSFCLCSIFIIIFGRGRHCAAAQLLRLGPRAQLANELVQVAVEHGRQVVGRDADAVVGDARLREVVGADFLAALTRAHLRAALGGLGLLAFLDFHLVQARAEDAHGAQAVLHERALVLAGDAQAGGQVREPHGGGVLLYVLPARARRAVGLHLHILVRDGALDLVHLGQHGGWGGGGGDAPGGLGDRHALPAVHARLEFEPRVGALASHLEDDLLEAAHP